MTRRRGSLGFARVLLEAEVRLVLVIGRASGKARSVLPKESHPKKRLFYLELVSFKTLLLALDPICEKG